MAAMFAGVSAVAKPSLSLAANDRISCSPGRSSQSLSSSASFFFSNKGIKLQRRAVFQTRAMAKELHSNNDGSTTKKLEVSNEQQDGEASDSEYESSDEENDGSATEEASLTGVESMLKKYREALSNSNEDAVKELDGKFEQWEKERTLYAKQVLTLNEEVLSLKERLLRLNADFDNFRKRSEKERISVSSNVKGDVVNSLLPMVDNFERAKTHIKIETEGEQRIDNSYQGIYKQFVEIMKGFGVSAVETVGKEFDPNIHEAIMREESSQYAEGVVIEEFRRGFMLGDKLLRPSMVKVSSGAPATTTPDPVVAEGTPELVEEVAE